MNTINLTGIQKVAILLSTLDADTAAEVIKEFNEEQIAAVTAAMSDIERVEKELVERVLYDLSEELKSNERIVKYDNNSFKKLLEKAIGVQKSEEIITSVQEGTIFPTPFSALREASDEDVIRILQVNIRKRLHLCCRMLIHSVLRRFCRNSLRSFNQRSL